jgi:hypothetical protein
VELLVPSDALEGLPDDVAGRLAEELDLARKPLKLWAQAAGSAEEGRRRVEDRLADRVRKALNGGAARRAGGRRPVGARGR